MNPFGDLLKALWAERGLHQAAFCRRVGKPAGWIQQIREAKKTPPIDLMPQWADALELTGPQRQHFLDVATIMHLPATERPRFMLLLTKAAHAGRSA